MYKSKSIENMCDIYTNKSLYIYNCPDSTVHHM